MFRNWVFACVFAVPSIVGAAQGVAFDGTDYRLAQVSVSDLEIANLYSPSRDRPDEPTLSIREFRDSTSLDEVLAEHIAQIRPTLLDDPLTLRRENAADDLVLISFGKTSDRNTVEYVLERFTRSKHGVVSYRYTQRLPANADLTPVLSRQPQRIEQLFRMNYGVREAM